MDFGDEFVFGLCLVKCDVLGVVIGCIGGK